MARSVMKHQFSQVPRADIPRSQFDRSHGHKTTFDAGYLVPFLIDEVLPGDTFNVRSTIFARLATPIAPIMDNMKLSTFYFAVPIRLIWDNWHKFNGEQEKPGDSTDYIVPVVSPNIGGYEIGSLSDHFGLPTGVNYLEVCSFWHRAYNLVWNEWFRDENLQDPVVVQTDDGPDNIDNYVLLRRGKRHDYFTSCLPWPQKGPGVELPLTGNAPITASGDTLEPLGIYSENYSGFRRLREDGGAIKLSNQTISEDGKLYADLTDVTAATINSLRQAFQLQKLYERDARGGTRYTEIIRSHFGVVSPDSRLQRPEYLGGSSSYVNITPVTQTSSTDGTSPQGNLSAFGLVADNGGFVKSFTEHCVIIGLVSVSADLTYQQGVNRMFSRRSRFDFYWPALSHLGEQAVLNKEIFAQGLPVDNDVFGYQERWAEYRYKPSLITGKMRSVDPNSLDVWHLSQQFTTLPTLSSQFIQDDPPVDRVIAVPSEPHFIMDSYINMNCARPMPVYSVPGLIDHF